MMILQYSKILGCEEGRKKILDIRYWMQDVWGLRVE